MRHIHVEIAKKLMKEIQLDNDVMTMYRHEYGDKVPVEVEYPPEYVLKIGQAVEKFVENNMNVRITDDFIEEVAAGDEGEVETKYGSLIGFPEIQQALGEYFDQGI